jgi:hypothetical protein
MSNSSKHYVCLSPLKIALISLATVVIFVLSWVLVSNNTLYPVPNSDIFQYIHDGQKYMKLTLPDNIHAPPGNPVLIGLLSSLFNFPNKEVVVAVWINIVSTIGAAIILTLILWKIQPILILPVLLIICSNPLTYLVGVDVTSEALFSFMVLLSLLLASRNNLRAALWVSWLSFLVRYEGAGLVISILLVMMLKNSKNTIKWFVISLCLFCGWITILHFHNSGDSILGNTFIQEIIAGKSNVPNLDIVEYLTVTLWYRSRFLVQVPWIWNTLILVSLSAAIFSKVQVIKISSIFSTFYILIHMSFPIHMDRYLFPLIWIVPMLLLYPLTSLIPKRKLIFQYVVVILLLLLSFYFGWLNQKHFLLDLASAKNDGITTRITADWFDTQEYEQHAIIIYLEPWSLSYYLRNPMAIVYQFDIERLALCDSMGCLFATFNYGLPYKDIYIVVEDYAMNNELLNDYWQGLFGIRHFYEFYLNHTQYDAELVYEWRHKNQQVKIYKIPTRQELPMNE